MNIEYKKIEINKRTSSESDNKYLKQLIALSKEWEKEKCSPSYDANDENYFIDKEVFVAIVGDKIIAYALGEIKILSEKTSYNIVGEKAFDLDELYVSKSYRDQKVGRQLYSYLESYLSSSVDLIGVIATSFKYNELLNFYINELDMNFNHALLVKRI